jgi:hypothetical protein
VTTRVPPPMAARALAPVRDELMIHQRRARSRRAGRTITTPA